MCRKVEFSGDCTQCGGSFVWYDLSQELSCLEAKNNGEFGDCRRGILVDQHTFDQECDACTAAAEEDEAVAGMEDDYGDGANTDRGEEDNGRKKKKQRTR